MKRRIIIRDVDGSMITTDIKGNPIPHFEIDMSDRENENAQASYLLEIQTMCNMGCWHTADHMQLPLWGPG